MKTFTEHTSKKQRVITEGISLLSESQVEELAGFSKMDAAHIIVEMAQVLEFYDNHVLTESMFDSGNVSKAIKILQDKLEKLGLNVEAGEHGSLINSAKKGGAGALKLFAAVAKGDKETVKKIANTEISYSEVLDFLLRLDLAYFHFVTPWIHTIDAITGWDLWINVQKRVGTTSHSAKQAIVRTFHDAIEFLKGKAEVLDGALKKTVINAVNVLDNTLSPSLKFI